MPMIGALGGYLSLFFFVFLILSIVAAVTQNGKFKIRILITAIYFVAAAIMGQISNSGYTLPAEDPGDVNFGVFFILSFITGLIMFVKRDKASAKKLNAHSSYPSVHLYGIPQVPAMSYTTLYLTNDKLVIKYRKQYFELFLQHITGAEAVAKDQLNSRWDYIYREGVSRGVQLKPWDVVQNGWRAVHRDNMRGTYLAIDYVTSQGERQLMIFNLMKIQNAKKAAHALTHYLRATQGYPHGNSGSFPL